jgi:hypothetical protein
MRRKTDSEVITQEIIRLIQSGSQEAPKPHKFVIERVSNLAFTVDIIQMIQCLFPWSLSLEDMSDCVKSSEIPQYQLIKRITKMLDADSKHVNGAAKSRLALPIRSSLNYTIHRGRTVANFAILRSSEANLVSFWKQWDETTAAVVGELLTTIMMRYNYQARVAYWTRPYRSQEAPKTPKTPKRAVSTIQRLLSLGARF